MRKRNGERKKKKRKLIAEYSELEYKKRKKRKMRAETWALLFPARPLNTLRELNLPML